MFSEVVLQKEIKCSGHQRKENASILMLCVMVEGILYYLIYTIHEQLLLFFSFPPKICRLSFSNTTFGLAASALFAKSLSVMTKLHAVKLHRVQLERKFFTTVAELASSMKVRGVYLHQI